MSPRLTALRVASLAALTTVIALPSAAAAQVSMFEACTTSAISSCAIVRLTTHLSGGGTMFEIALRNLGSQTTPALATDIFFLSLLTGQGPAAEFDAAPTPVAEGGAPTPDTSPWGIADFGDIVFLSPAGNNGLGGCASAPAAGSFGQMGQTCDPGQFVTFSFFTPNTYDASTITIGDLEFNTAPDGSIGDSCNDPSTCTITPLAPVSATPEPASILLTLTGLSGLVAIRRRRSGDNR